MQNPTKAEAERLLGISQKLLQNRDLNGSREFALLAQETEPLLEGSDQILAVIDVLLAADKRINNNLDWYSVLQIDRRSDDLELIKRQYRRLALLLHPDKNRFTFADHAFKLVADAWAVLSDPIKKAHYDKVFSFFSRVDLSVPSWVQQQEKYPPVRRTGPGPGPTPTVPGPRPSQNVRNATGAAVAREEVAADENSRRRNANVNFWTACPYCYRLYEYPRVYEGCCLRCPNCDRSFHGVEVPTMPQIVPGQEAYYCCWGFFPMGFVVGNFGSAEKEGAPVPEPELAPVPDPDLSSAPDPAPVPVPVPPQPISSLPNWMPVPAENGGNDVTPVITPTSTPAIAPPPARVTRAGAAVGVPNGVAVGSGSGSKRRGRPRKYAS